MVTNQGDRNRIGHVSRRGKVKNANKILIGKADKKRLLRRPKHRCEDRHVVLMLVYARILLYDYSGE
jgi:hypothetical protein